MFGTKKKFDAVFAQAVFAQIDKDWAAFVAFKADVNDRLSKLEKPKKVQKKRK